VWTARARFEGFASSHDGKLDALAILRVIRGKDTGPRSNIICLNAAPVLYVMAKASTLCDGIAMARDAIRVSNAECAWVTWQNAKPES
jgi:anthranilate phosphoribosyltransferase